MRSRSLAIATILGATAAAACAGRTTTVESGGEVVPAPVTPANNRTIPTGMTITTTLDQALGTSISKAGDRFTATVSQTHYASDGSVVIPAGAKVEGHVTATDDSDNPAEPALIRLAIDRVRFNGTSYPLSAAIVESSAVQSSERGSVDPKKVIIGGAVGAALGAILGDKDLDKIIIGGALGAAVGSVISMGTDVNATLPAGSQMTLRTTQMYRREDGRWRIIHRYADALVAPAGAGRG